MPIIPLDRPATAGTNTLVWECPFSKKDKFFLIGVESQNRGTISYLNAYLDTGASPELATGSINTIILKKLWTQRIGDSLHWEGKIPVYAPMKVCFGYFNAASGDELNARVHVEQ